MQCPPFIFFRIQNWHCIEQVWLDIPYEGLHTHVPSYRFGQDIQLVDKQLPSALANLSTRMSKTHLLNTVKLTRVIEVFKLLMQAIILFVVRPNMAITLPLVWVCMYFIQRVYLRTSRQLRFIDIESNSGLYTSFFQTVSMSWQCLFSHTKAYSWAD